MEVLHRLDLQAIMLIEIMLRVIFFIVVAYVVVLLMRIIRGR